MKYVIVDTRTDEPIATGEATFNPRMPHVEIWDHMKRLVDGDKIPSKNLLVGYTEEASQYPNYFLDYTCQHPRLTTAKG